MTPVTQSILNGRNGDCLRACVASVLDLELTAVPNFMDANEGDEWEDAWYDEFVKFLLLRGLFPVYMSPNEAELNGVYGYHLIQGKSPRGDYDHVVVGLNGRAVHDPYPGGNCVLESQRYIIAFASVRGGNIHD